MPGVHIIETSSPIFNFFFNPSAIGDISSKKKTLVRGKDSAFCLPSLQAPDKEVLFSWAVKRSARGSLDTEPFLDILDILATVDKPTW
jgi:hypothetical protein